MNKMKKCPECLRTLRVGEFNRSIGADDGRQTICRECLTLIRLELYRRTKAK